MTSLRSGIDLSDDIHGPPSKWPRLYNRVELGSRLVLDSCIPLAGIAALSMCYVICKDRRPVVAMSPSRISLSALDLPIFLSLIGFRSS